PGELAALKAARWDLAPSHYDAQKVGERFFESIRDFLNRGGTGSHNSQIVGRSAEIKEISRTAQGLRVVVEPNRILQLNADRGVTTGVHTRFAFELKYEGRGQNGMDHFSVVSVTHVRPAYPREVTDIWMTGDHWAPRELYYGREVFGINCESLYNNFPGFDFKATA